eukprot:Sspe_Gene.53903::Locus_29775_Transcript_1_1_Confidence_1.000_Length_844::g.53903::m.53903
MPPQVESNLLRADLWAEVRLSMSNAQKQATPTVGRRAPLHILTSVETMRTELPAEVSINELQTAGLKLAQKHPSTPVYLCHADTDSSTYFQGGVSFLAIMPEIPSGALLVTESRRVGGTKYMTTIEEDAVFFIPDFSSHWELLRPTNEYKQFMEKELAQHKHFVGSAAQLFRLLDNIEAAVQKCLSTQGLQLPPWRTASCWKATFSFQHNDSVKSKRLLPPQCVSGSTGLSKEDMIEESSCWHRCSGPVSI